MSHFERGEKTVQDIIEIPQYISTVEKNINRIAEAAQSIISRRCERLYLTGCGSSYYSVMLISFPLQISRFVPHTYMLPASEILMYHHEALSEKCCILAVSRSGETAEVLEVMKMAKEKGAYNIIITISKNSRSIEYADRYLYINAGIERGLVMTKSFYLMSLAGLVLTSTIVAGRSYGSTELSKLYEHSISIIERKNEMLKLAENYIKKGIRRFVFLGSGPAYPIALEASLKMKESSYIAAEAIHTLEFRHGHIAAYDKDMLIVIINQNGRSYPYVYKLYEELNAYANVLRLSNRDLDENTLPLSQTGYEELDSLSAIIPLQLIMYGYAVALGLDIDNPRRLVRVVTHY
ncbi:MAG: SIS domain-containing protein [Ignisphaera sp.]|nr:SIS domain-containing protein [Ignisphaera sp.]MCX8167842.1 SIS domain-containing protein [Ignisphaera sp.]MDW8086282.1 SIS domain-containing protein [Ignisphaera sp.]